MKLKELIIDTIIKTNLFEMAFEKRQAIDILINLQDHIALHLVKIFMYGSNSAVIHWQAELNAAFSRINRLKLKQSNKRLNRTILMNYLFDQPLGTIDDVQQYMNDIANSKNYRLIKIDEPDARVVHKNILWYMNNIVDELAQGTFIANK